MPPTTHTHPSCSARLPASLALQLSFTYAARKCNASTAATLDYLSLIWYLLADALVLGYLPSPVSLAGACLICAASLTAMLWTARHPASGAHTGEGAAAAATPLAYKRQHYGAAGVHGGSSEGEAVSLVAAAAASGASFADAVAAKQAAVKALAASAASPDRRAPKLGSLPDSLTDSGKSWQLGTEVDAALGTCAPAAAGEAAMATSASTCPPLAAASTFSKPTQSWPGLASPRAGQVYLEASPQSCTGLRAGQGWRGGTSVPDLGSSVGPPVDLPAVLLPHLCPDGVANSLGGARVQAGQAGRVKVGCRTVFPSDRR